MTFAAFLDRDGTIVVDKHFLADPNELELLPNAVEGLHELARLGARIVIVTNQSGVGRGLFDEAALERVNRRLVQMLEREGVRVDGIYVCPHAPEDGCSCRKPKPGLYLRAADELGIDIAGSFLIGDRESDVAAAPELGATGIRIGAAGVPDLLEAARVAATRFQR